MQAWTHAPLDSSAAGMVVSCWSHMTEYDRPGTHAHEASSTAGTVVSNPSTGQPSSVSHKVTAQYSLNDFSKGEFHVVVYYVYLP